MDKTFQVGIYSRDKIIYEGQAVSLIAPCSSGYLGVLVDHTPLVAKLSAGKISLRTSAGETSVIDSSSTGYLEVLKNQAILLL